MKTHGDRTGSWPETAVVRTVRLADPEPERSIKVLCESEVHGQLRTSATQIEPILTPGSTRTREFSPIESSSRPAAAGSERYQSGIETL